MQQGLFANKWMSFVSTMHVVKQTSTDVQMTVYNDLSYIPHGYSIKSILFPSEILGNKFWTVKPVQKLNKAYNKIQTTTIKNNTL